MHIYRKVNNENRGGSNKIFSLQQEEELYDDIKLNYIDKNRPLTNEIIKQLAIKKYKLSDNDSNFNASNGWCSKFKMRWNISTQKVKSAKASNKTTKRCLNKFNIDKDKVIGTSLKIKTKFLFFK